MLRLLLKGLTPLTLALLLAGCAQGGEQAREGTPQVEGPPIKIGAAVSLTGRFAPEASYTKEGYELAVKMLNERGGILGRKVELVMYDDESDAARAVALYRKLIFEDRVDLLLGPYGTPINQAVLPVVEEAQVPMLASTTGTGDLWRGKSYRWSTQFEADLPSGAVNCAELVAREGFRTVAIIRDNTTAAKAMAPVFRRELGSRGVQVLLEEEFVPGQVDYAALASKAKATGADVFGGCVAFYAQDAIGFAKAFASVGYKPRMVMMGTGVPTDDFKALGDLAECVIGLAANTGWLPEVRFKGYLATTQEFLSRYQREYGRLPDYRGPLAFGAVELLAQAIESSLKERGSVDKAYIAQYLRTVKAETVSGPYQVIADGPDAGVQVAATWAVVQWQKDPSTGQLKLQAVWPKELATTDRICYK